MTGTPPASSFAGVAVNPLEPGIFVVLDGAAGGPLGPVLLPADGLSLSFGIPAGLGGLSVYLQGFTTTSSAA